MVFVFGTVAVVVAAAAVVGVVGLVGLLGALELVLVEPDRMAMKARILWARKWKMDLTMVRRRYLHDLIM